jgi:hypothetical protein
MKVHLSLRGEWVECRAQVRTCPRLFHLPNMTLAEVKALPVSFLEPLIEAIDPPTQAFAAKEWLDKDGHWHRDHDLPARIDFDGTRYWYQHNIPSKRPRGAANTIYPDGSMEWYDENAELHRDGGLPAVIYPDLGYKGWYRHGRLTHEEPEGGAPVT